ncbi:hypothetical protein [Bythopirellula goksoeyrii]|uniref:hypothetical protein n=1 Tax=Bythopirellula goksoeyrii TaxID=1400387 RepID=UPI0011CD4B42|nr:hypothetical protein [Bythopirellula goksoeyrii]
MRYNQKRSRLLWEELREKFESDGINDMRDATAANYFSTFKVLEEMTNPKHLADLTTERVTLF